MWRFSAVVALLVIAFFYGEHCALHGLADEQKTHPAFHSRYDDVVIGLGVAKATADRVAHAFKPQQAMASNNGGTAEHTLHTKAKITAEITTPQETSQPVGKSQTTSQRAQLASEMLNLPLK